MNFIDENIKIDFAIPNSIRLAIADCEQADRDNNLGLYLALADTLTDSIAKRECAAGKISQAQWELIERRYHQ